MACRLVGGQTGPPHKPVGASAAALSPASADRCCPDLRGPGPRHTGPILQSLQPFPELPGGRNPRGPEGLSLPETRYLLSSLQLRAETDTVRCGMHALLVASLGALRSLVRSRLELETEILALRHQLAVLQRQAPRRPRLGRADRLLWVLLSRLWPNWRRAVQIVTPDTVVRWHRRGFALYWRWKSRPRGTGRPAVAVDIRALIRQMHAANALWGAPRIHGELRKLGLQVSQTTVAKYLGRRDRSPSPTWRTFLTHHVSQLASIDFFTVPTATFRVLFVFVVLSHDRRRIVHLNVTAHPTAAWTVQQLREAWPWDTAPRFVIRDRDAVYGSALQQVTQAMGIEEVLTAPRSPWQNPFVERVIGYPSPRVPRPRHRVERALVAPPPPAVPRLLSRMAHSPLPGEGCARPAGGTAANLRHDRPGPTRRRSASPLRTSRRLTVALSATQPV